MEREELIYEKGDASADELSAAVEQFFSALDGDDQELLEDAEDHGVDLEALKRAGPQAITLREESRERMGAETAIVVGLVVHVAGNAWDDVVLPWLKRKLGSTALGKKLKDRS
jgi:hypothetical protein